MLVDTKQGRIKRCVLVFDGESLRANNCVSVDLIVSLQEAYEREMILYWTTDSGRHNLEAEGRAEKLRVSFCECARSY